MMWHGNWSSADWVFMSFGMLLFWFALVGVSIPHYAPH